MSLIILDFRRFIVLYVFCWWKDQKVIRDIWILKIMGSQLSFFSLCNWGSMHEVGEFITSLLQIFTLHWEDGLDGTRVDETPFNRFWISAFRLHEDWHKGSTTKEKLWAFLRLFRILTWKGEFPWFSGKKTLFLKWFRIKCWGETLNVRRAILQVMDSMQDPGNLKHT